MLTRTTSTHQPWSSQVVAEERPTAMRSWAGVDDPLATSALTRTELMRAVRRVHPDQAPLVRQLLETVQTVDPPGA